MNDFNPNHLEAADTLLVVVDMQQKLLPAISEGDSILRNTVKLVEGAKAIGIRTIVTEQYPKGLGATVSEVSEKLAENTPVIEKISFSVFGSSEFATEAAKQKFSNVIFCGIESDICVLQSILAARAAGYRVFVAIDAVGSRRNRDRDAAIATARQAGAIAVSSDSIMFMFLKSAAHGAFKTISKLVR
jgi:nicotinamidase-related amidase